jgi:hypothetical protein
MLFAASHVSVSLRYFSNLEVTIVPFAARNKYGERLKKIDVFFLRHHFVQAKDRHQYTIDIKTRFSSVV